MKFQLIYFLEGSEQQTNETIERENLRQVKYYCSKLKFVANVQITNKETMKTIYYKRNLRTIKKQ